MIPALVTATHFASQRLSSRHIAAIENAVEHAAGLPRSPGWERKASAHAKFFTLLAEVVDEPPVAGVLSLGAEVVRDLAIATGPAADGIIINSRRRLLACLRAGDADAAEDEMQAHLRCLHFMWRLAAPPRVRTARDLHDRHGPRSTGPGRRTHDYSIACEESSRCQVLGC